MIWVAIVVGVCLFKPDVRQAGLAVLRTAGHPKVVTPVALLAAAAAAAVACAERFGLWNWALTTETLIWFLLSAFAGLNAAATTKRWQGFAVPRLIRVIGITAALGVVVNAFVLPLAWELVLLPILALLGAATAVGERKPETKPAARLAEGLLVSVGLALLLFAVYRVATAWNEIDWHQLGRSAALPLWLTLVLVPFLSAVWLFAAYEDALGQVEHFSPERKLRWRSRWALTLGLRWRGAEVWEFVYPWSAQLASAESFRDARSVVHAFRVRQRGDQSPEDGD